MQTRSTVNCFYLILGHLITEKAVECKIRHVVKSKNLVISHPQSLSRNCAPVSSQSHISECALSYTHTHTHTLFRLPKVSVISVKNLSQDFYEKQLSVSPATVPAPVRHEKFSLAG